ncbi:unnamed protein product [Cyprideis torosa]|uniref:long-chain-fatty-acid--CoA ligase n=1 Tax=Cyprideis torosa TaxID=163714 RepID=A0A7R8WDE9_9CRUS|nr:unnamed protein product [Cyprideis torosa]CAG0893084.1 unnamed protein product [Cyprideis torosa]
MGKTESTASQECSIWFRMTFGLLVFCYDAATYIFYYLYQNPSAALKARRKVQAFKFAVDKFGSRKCLGTRKILSEEGEEQSDGRFFMKYCLGDYEWTTYNEMREAATGFGLGLKELGVRKGEKVAILAETRAEWLIAAYACMGQSFPVVTLYATLGESAIAHGISETECETVITSQDLLPKFKKILSDAPSVKRVIYMEPQLPQALPSGLPDSVEYIRFSDVVKKGRSSDEVEKRKVGTE